MEFASPIVGVAIASLAIWITVRAVNRRDDLPFAMHRLSYVLCYLCLIGLAFGMIYEVATHAVVFDSYLATFPGCALAFGCVCWWTRPID